jgi:hypothetical protein
MAQAVKDLDLSTEIVCVDTWLGSLEFWEGGSRQHNLERDLRTRNGYPSVYYQFLANVMHTGMDGIITPCPMVSSAAARFFSRAGIKAGMIYIDASHEEEDVANDVRKFRPLSRGLVFGDDWDWPSVRRAVSPYKPQVIDGRYWVIR